MKKICFKYAICMKHGGTLCRRRYYEYNTSEFACRDGDDDYQNDQENILETDIGLDFYDVIFFI